MSRRSIPFSYKMRYPQQTRLIARLSGAGEAIEMRRQASATPPALTGMELLRKLAFQSGSLPCDMSLPHRKTRFPRRIPVSKSMRWNSYSSLRIISWPPFFAELGAARPPCTFSGLPASLWRRASRLPAFSNGHGRSGDRRVLLKSPSVRRHSSRSSAQDAARPCRHPLPHRAATPQAVRPSARP